jgi:hypothetical protein
MGLLALMQGFSQPLPNQPKKPFLPTLRVANL